MQIDNSANNAALFQAIGQQNSATSGQNATRRPALEQNKEEASNRPQRIEFDRRVVAQLDQERQSTTGYDAPPSKNRLAIAAYEGVTNLERRDNVKQVFGVDLFA